MTQADIPTVSAEQAAADLRAFAARGPMPADTRTDLIGVEREAMVTLFAEAGLPKFRASQVWQWRSEEHTSELQSPNCISSSPSGSGSRARRSRRDRTV